MRSFFLGRILWHHVLSLVHVAFIFQSNRIVLNWKDGSWSTYLVHTRVRIAAFTFIQMNRTNRAITPEFVLIEPNMPSVNTPLEGSWQLTSFGTEPQTSVNKRWSDLNNGTLLCPFNLIYNLRPLSFFFFFLLTNARVNRGYVDPTWISLSLHSNVICCMNIILRIKIIYFTIIYSSLTHFSIHTVQNGWIII